MDAGHDSGSGTLDAGPGGQDSGPTVDSGMGVPDAGSGATTVAAFRMSLPAPGASLAFNGVVIVGWVTSTKYGHIWVQDPGGGPYSGVQLFCNYGGTTPNCPMTRTQVESLVRGQVVNVTGNYNPFTPSSPASAPTLVEVGAPMVTPTGSMMDPVAVSVSPSDVSKGMVSADMYAGVYVTMTGSFTVSSVTASEFMNTSYSCTTSGDGGMSASAPQYFGFEMTDGTNTMAVGLGFYKSESYCLDSCFDSMCTSATTAGHMLVSTGETFTGLTGVVEPASSSTESYLQVSPVVDMDLPM